MKGDLKKANADVAKLRKKASKKAGKQEYTDQFRESMKVRFYSIVNDSLICFAYKAVLYSSLIIVSLNREFFRMFKEVSLTHIVKTYSILV